MIGVGKGPRHARSILAVAASVVVLSAIAGGTFTLANVTGNDAERLAGLDADVIEAGAFADSRIEYPQSLQQLPAPPGRLAVDAHGVLWFPLYEDGFTDAVLYSYDQQTESRSSLDLPDAPGSQLFSGLELLPDGRVVVAYDTLVVAVRPKDGSVKTIELPAAPDAAKQQQREPGHWITDTTTGDDGLLYVGRMNSTSVTTVDMDTGAIDEIPIPSSFGPVERIQGDADGVYISNRFGSIGIESQVARISYGGEFTLLAFTAIDLIDSPGGSVVAVSTDKALDELSASGEFSADSLGSASQYLSGFHDAVMFDTTGAAWVSGRGKGVISRVTSSGADTFQLDSYVVPFRCPPSLPDPPEYLCDQGTQTIGTRVDAIVESPGGAVYFSDASDLRIGVIAPSK